LTGIPQGRLSEYKTGKRVATLNTLEAFADGLAMSEAARRSFGLASGTGASTTPMDTDEHPSSLIDVLSLAWMAGSLDTRMDRRAVLQLAGTALAAPFVGVEEPTERLAFALAGAGGLHEDTVTFLEQRTVGLHRVEPMFQARQVHRAIMAHLREVTALLEGHGRDFLRPRLAKIAGETAVLAAWTAWDLGEPMHASRMYRIVELAAREAGDPVIVACANTYRSYATHGPNSHEDARRLLADARQCLPIDGDHATRAWVLGREAEEAAAIGDPIAKELIKQAMDAFHRARPQRERPWTRFLDESRIDAMRLSTYTWLGDEQQVTSSQMAYSQLPRRQQSVLPS
jgi:hypothetical protein